MTKTKHTPGPWEIKTFYRGRYEVMRDLGDDCGFDDICDVKGIDNANLIAAAPDLLEACMKAYNLVSDIVALIDGNPTVSKILMKIGNAIAKAEGE